MISEIQAQKTPKLKLPEYVIDNKLGDITPPWPCYHFLSCSLENQKVGKAH